MIKLNSYIISTPADFREYFENLDGYIEEYVRFRNKRTSLPNEVLFDQIFEHKGILLRKDRGFSFTITNDLCKISIIYDGKVYSFLIDGVEVLNTDKLFDMTWEWNNRVVKGLYMSMMPEMEYIDPPI